MTTEYDKDDRVRYTTTMTYDDQGHLVVTEVRGPTGDVEERETLVRDKDGVLRAAQRYADGASERIVFSYDPRGRPVLEEHDVGLDLTWNIRTSLSYNDAGVLARKEMDKAPFGDVDLTFKYHHEQGQEVEEQYTGPAAESAGLASATTTRKLGPQGRIESATTRHRTSTIVRQVKTRFDEAGNSVEDVVQGAAGTARIVYDYSCWTNHGEKKQSPVSLKRSGDPQTPNQ